MIEPTNNEKPVNFKSLVLNRFNRNLSPTKKKNLYYNVTKVNISDNFKRQQFRIQWYICDTRKTNT